MLVRFLSFVASVLGTARYKAIVLSCLALIFSLSGIAAVAAWHGGRTSNTASQLEQSASEDGKQQGSPQLGEKRKQTIQDTASQQNSQAGQQSATSNRTSSDIKTPDTDTQTTPTDLITVSQVEIAIAAGAASDPITATVATDANTTNLTLEAIVDTNLGLTLERQETTTGELRFVIRTSADIKKDRTYDVLIVAKDAAQKVVASKIVTVAILQ